LLDGKGVRSVDGKFHAAWRGEELGPFCVIGKVGRLGPEGGSGSGKSA
jgi:hypothetical protein